MILNQARQHVASKRENIRFVKVFNILEQILNILNQILNQARQHVASKREAFLAVERALFHFDQVLHLVDQLDQVGMYMKNLTRCSF